VAVGHGAPAGDRSVAVSAAAEVFSTWRTSVLAMGNYDNGRWDRLLEGEEKRKPETAKSAEPGAWSRNN